MAVFQILPRAAAILRFMLEIAPILRQAEALIPAPGRGKEKKSLVMGLLRKTVGFLGDENIIREKHADAGASLLALADAAIDGVVEVLNETGAIGKEAGE